MKKIVASLMIVAITINMVGCASLQGGDPVRINVAPGGQGAAVGVNPTMLKQVWDWSCDNWGKLATGAVVGGATYWYGEKQKWWGGSSSVSDSGNTASTQSTDTKNINKNPYSSTSVDIQGDGNTINQTIYQVYGPMNPVAP